MIVERKYKTDVMVKKAPKMPDHADGLRIKYEDTPQGKADAYMRSWNPRAFRTWDDE